MKCYNHKESDAIAICKNCHSALCLDCSIDVTNGIACKEKCEEEVRAINELHLRGMLAYKKASKVYFSLAVYSGLMGLIMITFGGIYYMSAKLNILSIFLIPIGIVLLMSAGFYVRAANKIKSIKE